VGAAGLWGLAERAARRPELPLAASFATVTLVVFLGARLLWLFDVYRAPGWGRVETPAGSLFVHEPIARATGAAVLEIGRRVPPGRTLLGFPEAGFFQYVLGLASLLPEDQFFPGHLVPAAEREAISRVQRQPPDLVVYVNVLTVGHGALAFGRDYLTGLDAAVRSVSTPVAAFGPGAREGAAIGDPDFFIEIRAPLGGASPP
jgi:hypothetical protein